MKEVKREKERENYSNLASLPGRCYSQRPRALSAAVPSVFIEELTHNINVLRLPPHRLACLLSSAVHCQLPTHASLTTAALLVGPAGSSFDRTSILPHFWSFLQHSLAHNTTRPLDLKIIQSTCPHPLFNPNHTPQLVL